MCSREQRGGSLWKSSLSESERKSRRRERRSRKDERAVAEPGATAGKGSRPATEGEQTGTATGQGATARPAAVGTKPSDMRRKRVGETAEKKPGQSGSVTLEELMSLRGHGARPGSATLVSGSAARTAYATDWKKEHAVGAKGVVGIESMWEGHPDGSVVVDAARPTSAVHGSAGDYMSASSSVGDESSITMPDGDPEFSRAVAAWREGRASSNVGAGSGAGVDAGADTAVDTVACGGVEGKKEMQEPVRVSDEGNVIVTAEGLRSAAGAPRPNTLLALSYQSEEVDEAAAFADALAEWRSSTNRSSGVVSGSDVGGRADGDPQSSGAMAQPAGGVYQSVRSTGKRWALGGMSDVPKAGAAGGALEPTPGQSVAQTGTESGAGVSLTDRKVHLMRYSDMLESRKRASVIAGLRSEISALAHSGPPSAATSSGQDAGSGEVPDAIKDLNDQIEWSKQQLGLLQQQNGDVEDFLDGAV